MTRIAQTQLTRRMINDILANHRDLVKAGEQVSSGFKVEKPGDSDVGGSIQGYRNAMDRFASYQSRIEPAKSQLTFQDDILKQAGDLMLHAKELATQGANETNGVTDRAAIAREIFQLRDQMVTFANSKYQGRFIYGGAADATAPFALAATQYTNPATGAEHEHYAATVAAGSTLTQDVRVTDDISVTMTTPGANVFGGSIEALERLGRALSGYATNPASGTPDGTGAAFVFPADRGLQTTAIQGSIDLITTAMDRQLTPERVDIGARLKRLDIAGNVLDSAKASAQGALDNLQNADEATAASQFSQAQYALQAAMQVSAKVLNMSILDYL